jgi:hypothetical protein
MATNQVIKRREFPDRSLANVIAALQTAGLLPVGITLLPGDQFRITVRDDRVFFARIRPGTEEVPD